MSNKIILLLSLLVISCNAALKPADVAFWQNVFNYKGKVKEIRKTTQVFSTTGEENIVTKTRFNKQGEPVETITYDKDGKVKNREPWIRAKKDELKGWELKEEFDNKKRLISSTQYNNGAIEFQNFYTYDSVGNKIKEYKKLENKEIASIYVNKLLTEEVTYSKTSDNKLYWYVKRKLHYDKNLNLEAVFVFHAPDEDKFVAKTEYKYDAAGTMIEEIEYDGENKIILQINREIVYY